MNSRASLFRLAASLNLTEENKSDTTARTRLGSCLGIDVCFSRITFVLEIEGWDSRILTRKSWLRPCQTTVLIFPPACPAGIAQPCEESRKAAPAARARRVVIHSCPARRRHPA